jgi:hypothetical protein
MPKITPTDPEELAAKVIAAAGKPLPPATAHDPDDDEPPTSISASIGLSPTGRSVSATTERLAKRKYRQLLPAEWAQIRVLWEMGLATLDQMASNYGVNGDTLRQRIKKEGWVRGCRAAEIGEATADDAKGVAKKQVEAIDRIKKEYLNYTSVITRLTMNEITSAVKDKKPMSSTKESMAALQKAAQIIATMRDENYHLLGMYEDGRPDEEIPEIGISEYTPDEIERLQKNFSEVQDELAEIAAKNALPTFEDEET